MLREDHRNEVYQWRQYGAEVRIHDLPDEVVVVVLLMHIDLTTFSMPRIRWSVRMELTSPSNTSRLDLRASPSSLEVVVFDATLVTTLGYSTTSMGCSIWDSDTDESSPFSLCCNSLTIFSRLVFLVANLSHRSWTFLVHSRSVISFFSPSTAFILYESNYFSRKNIFALNFSASLWLLWLRLVTFTPLLSINFNLVLSCCSITWKRLFSTCILRVVSLSNYFKRAS